MSVDAGEVEAALASVEPLVIDPGDPEARQPQSPGAERADGRRPGYGWLGGLARRSRGRLSDDRRAQLKSLGWKLVLSGVSFTIVTSLSAWLLDPGGGASPARSALASVLRSNREVPILVAVAGAAIAGAVVLLWRKRDLLLRRGRPDEETDSTGERELVRVG